MGFVLEELDPASPGLLADEPVKSINVFMLGSATASARARSDSGSEVTSIQSGFGSAGADPPLTGGKTQRSSPSPSG